MFFYTGCVSIGHPESVELVVSGFRGEISVDCAAASRRLVVRKTEKKQRKRKCLRVRLFENRSKNTKEKKLKNHFRSPLPVDGRWYIPLPRNTASLAKR